MKHKKGLIILITIAVVSVIFGSHSIYKKIHEGIHFAKEEAEVTETFSEDYSDEFDEEDFATGDKFSRIISKSLSKNKDSSIKRNLKKPYVAVIYITGVISEENKTYNQKWLLKKIKSAKNDPNNRGILLKIDSPGGTVYESDEAYLALMDYKESTKRPVFAYFGSLAASGGYYIGCSADKIFANRNTLTGSIGVIAGGSLDATGLLDKIGVKMTTITAGRNKNMGNYNAPLTEEQRAIMQSIADEAYEQFTGIVADSRKMSISEIKKLADGRIYTAAQAQKNGLVDEICSFENAKESIKKSLSESEENSKKEVNFIEYKYQFEENWMSFLYGAASFAKNPEASIYGLLGNTAGKCLYLYQ